MARRKPRKSAGPQPHHNPKRAKAEAQAGGTAAAKPKRRAGEPHPPSFKGVAIRAAIVSALFYPYLVYIMGEAPGPSGVLTLVAFLMMLPLGLFLDRFRYKRQMARWQQKRGGAAAKP